MQELTGLMVVLPRQRLALAIAASLAGIAASWLAKTPLGLSAPVAALFLYASGRLVPLFYAALGTGFAVSLLAALLDADGMHDLALEWAAFFAVALSISAIIVMVSTAVRPLSDAIWCTGEDGMVSNGAAGMNRIQPEDQQKAAHAAARAFWTGVPQVMRYRQRQADGRYCWTETRTEPKHRASDEISDRDGKRDQLTNVGSNPPGDNETEAVRSAKIIENLFGNGWAFDATGRWIYLPLLAQTTLGRTPEELNSTLDEGDISWKKLLHPDEHDEVAANWKHCLNTGEPFNGEFRIRRKTGYAWARSAARPVRDTQGRISGWYGTSIDIDVQRKTVDALRERERELSQLVDLVPSHIWRLTPDGEPIFFNKRMVDYLGLDVPDTDIPDMSRLEAVIVATIHPDDAAGFRAGLSHSLTTGESFATRYRLRRADGVYRWMSSRGEPLRDRNGRIVQWYGLCHDIDDQVHAEEALQRSERHLQRLIDALPIHIVSWTVAGELTYVSKRYLEQTGLFDPTFEEFARATQDLVHPEDASGVRQAAARSRETGDPFVKQYRRRGTDGAFRWVDGRFEPLRDQDGTIVEWFGLSIDIDDLVNTQEALRKRERELQALVDTVPVQIWCVTPAGEPSYINKTMMDYIGIKLADLDAEGGLAAAIQVVVHPDDRAALLGTLSHSFTTGEPFAMKYRNRRWDGAYRWTEGRAEPLRDDSDAIVQWFGVCVDIDDLVTTEEALRDRERELSYLVDMVPSYLWRLTPEGEPNFYNKRLVDYFGPEIANADKPGVTRLAAILEAAVHPDDAPAMREALNHSISTGESFSRQYRLRGSGGDYRWVSARAEPLRDDSGRILQWYGLTHDIDDQMRAEDALRESERSLRQVVETLPAMIDCATPEGEPIYRSQKLREFLGYNLEDLDGAGVSRLAGTLDAGVHPDDVAGVKEQYAHSLSTGEPYARKHRLRRHDGEYRWVETRAAAMRNAEGAIVQWNVICLDIDGEVRAHEDLRLAQEGLARASQAASLAELSASIAHEVNQPLAAVVANSHAGQRWLEADPPNIERAQKAVERIIRDANAAADVVSRIRALFKQSSERREATSLGSVAKQARELLVEDALRRGVRFDVEVQGNLPLVALDRVQIQQVLVNLIRNGMEAMDSVRSDKILQMRMRRVGDTVQTEISDTGPGIVFPGRIFEPFFTTKGHGMGMGLAISRSIVESHGGRLWAEKDQPQGATFIFTLPVEVSNK